MLIVLFGTVAAGKSYVGEALSKHLGYVHIDGDSWLTAEMLAAIAQKRPFTQGMREHFTEVVINDIKVLLKNNHNGLIVSQGLYKKSNRQQIKDAFSNSLFIHVVVDEKVMEERLMKRGGDIDLGYARLINKGFEPDTDCAVINNNADGDEEIIRQMRGILSEFSKKMSAVNS